jgi:diguanylate cyclase (GGDEF)-like protein/PAS domain S-box-containing protein
MPNPPTVAAMPGLALSSIAELLDILPDAVLVVDGDSRIVYANPAVRPLLGHTPQALVGEPLSQLLPPAVREAHDGQVRRFQQAGAPTLMGSRPVLAAMHKSGRVVPVSISICNLGLDDGRRVSVAVVHDVSALNTHLDRATELAETDTLTGLGNRLRLSRRMQVMLQGPRPFALLFMDLVKFKPFNDRFGHEAGDEALCVVGQRLQAQVRQEDLVVRLGGDEFVALLDGLDDEAHLHERAMAMEASLSRPLRVAAGRGSVGVNIGGALRPRHGNDEAGLLAAADRAMYAAKQSGEGYRLAEG